MKILLTGFEPFGKSDLNPSEIIVHTLAERAMPGIQLATAILPVDLDRGPAALLQVLDASQPQAVVCLGLAAQRTSISLERVAINLLDFRIPDNAGVQVNDQAIVADGPAAYFTTLPLRAMQAAIQQAGIPAELSLSAGSYLCNQVTYILLHYLATQSQNIPAGFIHLPFLPEQVAQQPRPAASMSLDNMTRAIEIALQVLAGEGQVD